MSLVMILYHWRKFFFFFDPFLRSLIHWFIAQSADFIFFFFYSTVSQLINFLLIKLIHLWFWQPRSTTLKGSTKNDPVCVFSLLYIKDFSPPQPHRRAAPTWIIQTHQQTHQLSGISLRGAWNFSRSSQCGEMICEMRRAIFTIDAMRSSTIVSANKK